MCIENVSGKFLYLHSEISYIGIEILFFSIYR
jgi:hypothetical protein